MRALFIVLTICHFATETSAASTVDLKDRCGVVELDGYLRKDGESFVLKIYEKSRSEIVFKLDKNFDSLAGLFVNEAVRVKGELKKPVEKYRGELSMLGPIATGPFDTFNRDDIGSRVPDPISPQKDSGVKFIEEKKCER